MVDVELAADSSAGTTSCRPIRFFTSAMVVAAISRQCWAPFRNASFTPTWEPATKSWLVHVTTSGGLEGDYRIFEELAFTVDAVNQMIPGEC